MKTFLKFTVLSTFLLMLVGIMASCTNEEQNEQVALKYGCLNDKCFDFENGLEFSDIVEIKFMIGNNVGATFASSGVKNGHFMITLPEALSQNYLRPLSQGTLWLSPTNFRPSTIIVSDENVYVSGVFRFAGYTKDGLERAVFSLFTEERNMRYSIAFVYAVSDVTILGYSQEWGISLPMSPYLIASNRIYSIELKKGWNTLLFTTQGGVSGTTTITAQCLTFLSDVRWRGSRLIFNYF